MQSTYGLYTVSFLPEILSNFNKIANFMHQISLGNVMLWHNDMHILLLKRFLASLIYIRIIGSAYDTLSDIKYDRSCVFSIKQPLHFQENN